MVCLRLSVLGAMLLALLVGAGCDDGGDGDADGDSDADADDGADGDADADGEIDGDLPDHVPLAPDSPWPKFRRNAAQTGASPDVPAEGGQLWDFDTGMGIFSSPVIGGDGTIYIGSADQNFYALNPDGSERWHFTTGEIIDSAALLDDLGRVYFGSGDGHLYAVDAQTGDEIWRFQADDPAERNAFIRWFEGNVAIGLDGNLYAPNDNFYLYAIDRETGERVWRFAMMDQTWSLPAVDETTGTLYVGNNNMIALLGDDTFAIGITGHETWSHGINGSVVASPLLTGDGVMVVGGFDGILRAYDMASGDELWTFGTRDHIYASPALLPDGTIVQPSADGTIYDLDPATGGQLWAFDAMEPIRSSPAVDGDGAIYVGSGEGRLFVLEPDGTLRWALRLVDEGRNDLNSSPALGSNAIYIAGESGQIFSVPYDYCLHETDDRCTLGPDEDLPSEGAFLLYTSPYGGVTTEPPAAIDSNQLLAFSLFVREAGDTALALIDSGSVSVTVEPPIDVTVRVSGGRRFLTVVPSDPFVADADGVVSITVTGEYLVDLDRDGLHFTGGQTGGTFEGDFSFDLTDAGPADIPLPIPATPGEPSGVWELARLSAPLPTILPSYNQIGFDQLRYLIGLVEGNEDHGVAWFVGARQTADGLGTEIDPETLVMAPFEVAYSDGALTLRNQDGMSLNVMAADISFDSFVIAAKLDADGEGVGAPQVHAETDCRSIALYGPFMDQLGFCNPESHLLTAFGTAMLLPHEGGTQSSPAGLGVVTLSATSASIDASLTGSSLRLDEHVFGILLIDAATGRPIRLDYPFDTQRVAGDDGTIESVNLDISSGDVPAQVRAYLMVDAYPAAVETLTIP